MKHNLALFAYLIVVSSLFGGCSALSSRSYGCDFCGQLLSHEMSQPKVKSEVEKAAHSRYH